MDVQAKFDNDDPLFEAEDRKAHPGGINSGNTFVHRFWIEV